MNIIMMGPQGSGKGSQGEKLAEVFNIPFVSTGDLYRAHVQIGSDIGKIAKDIINRGDLMPDEITRTLIEEELSKNEYKNGVVIDGYPRNIQQANDLDRFLNVDYLIQLDVPKEITVKRISNRRSCKNGHIYNLVTRPSKKEGICDFDNEKLFIREDDKPEFIKKRLEIYENQTVPVVEYYKKQGKLLVFDATQNIQAVHKDIINRIKAIINK